MTAAPPDAMTAAPSDAMTAAPSARKRTPAKKAEAATRPVTPVAGTKPAKSAGPVSDGNAVGTTPAASVPTPPDSTTDQAPPIAADNAAKGATMGKPADTKTTPAKQASASEAKATRVAPRTSRSAAETEKIRVALGARRDELKEEYEATISEITELQRDRLTDSAGDDQADTGTKTFEREQEISLANSILERVTQVERALERLDEGSYGWCERCGNPIPVERLAAFPSATLCVTCKQLEERR